MSERGQRSVVGIGDGLASSQHRRQPGESRTSEGGVEIGHAGTEPGSRLPAERWLHTSHRQRSG